MKFNAACLQLTSNDQPKENLDQVIKLSDHAVKDGAKIILTPENTFLLTLDEGVLKEKSEDYEKGFCINEIIKYAKSNSIWFLIGGTPVKENNNIFNRSVLISPKGEIVTTYDKIHMFDVTVSSSESYKESDGYKPGDRAVLSQTPFGTLGMTICYDLRFPQLYRDLAQKGAQLISVPAAFSCTTGPAHWEILLRARAIETGCFLLAAAQSGTHATNQGAARRTYGHSMVISPWGEVLLNLKSALGFGLVDLNLEDVDTARNRVPSLRADTQYAGPYHA